MRRSGPLTVSDIVCRRTTEVLRRRTLAEANSGLKCTAGIEVIGPHISGCRLCCSKERIVSPLCFMNYSGLIKESRNYEKCPKAMVQAVHSRKFQSLPEQMT